MKNLIEIKTLSKDDITGLIDLTSKVKANPSKYSDQSAFKDKLVFSMFSEPSTRTKLSFQLAAKRLGASVVDVSKVGSSSEKGESLRDMIKTIESLKAHVVIIRDKASGTAQYVARKTNLKVVNAGDGMNEHPTQALLDIFTIYQVFHNYTGLKIAIVGDILHSRVAHSNMFLHEKLGNKVILCGPPTLVPELYKDLFKNVEISYDFDSFLPKVDVVMMLRIQTERQSEVNFPSFREFARLYSLTKERMGLLKKDAIVMHPGPVNRDVEITAPALEDEHSVVLAQVGNGLFLRMAVLYSLLK
ncbi:MAG: aspartate carbamoyltransferase catalytic subunit [Planctomycetes bacterium]|nr:aspartate carbamoyltransferase catalytic subunit [Planctomycetota bacterium]